MTSKLSRLLAAFLALAPALAFSMPPGVGFSARIADSGRPVTGSHAFTFSFWDCDGADTSTCFAPDHVLWTESQTLPVNDGVVTAVLGADAALPFPATLFDGSLRWLSVSMDGAAFGPFMAVNSVPYALRAALAENATMATTAASANSVAWANVSGRPALTCKTVSSAALSVAAGGYNWTYATCDQGTVTGGGVTWGSYNTAHTGLNEPYYNGWRGGGTNGSAAAQNLYVFARCCWIP